MACTENIELDFEKSSLIFEATAFAVRMAKLVARLVKIFEEFV
jgi:hypothetical protein